jgi:hypothetical protein
MIMAVYQVLFDFSLLGSYGVKLNHQTDKLSLVNTISLLSLFTLPICNTLYNVALDEKLQAKTQFSVALQGLLYPVVFDKHMLTEFINFILPFLIFVQVVMIAMRRLHFDLYFKLTL